MAAGCPERRAERRRDTGDLRGHVAERLPQRQRAPRVADGLLDHLDVGQVRRRAAHLHAVPCEHPHPARLSLVSDLGHQPGLADAWLPSDQRQLAMADQRVVDKSTQAGPLCLALHERREPRRHSNAAGTR